MAFQKTTISAAVGGDPSRIPTPGPWGDHWLTPWDPGLVGSPMQIPQSSTEVPNHAEDVRKIEALLNDTLRIARPMPVDGICDHQLVSVICDVQRELGLTPDGVISPTGKTLRLLNGIAHPAELTKAQVGNFEKGMYDIAYREYYEDPKFPACFDLLLSLGNANPMVYVGGEVPASEYEFAIDVREERRSDVLTKDNIVKFLDALARLKLWAKKCKLRLYLIHERRLVWQSNEREIDAPVAPYEGRLTPAAFGTAPSQPKMVYVGTGGHPFIGRRLWKIGAKYWFRYGSRVTTENQHRGMDCINFVGSVYQIATRLPPTANPYFSSPNMADELGASPVVWTETLPPPAPPQPGQQPVPPQQPLQIANGQGTGEAIKKYFEDPTRTQTYLIWTGGHIRIIVNKTVHEWAHSSNGYKSGPVSAEATVKDNTTYHLYSLPANRQF